MLTSDATFSDHAVKDCHAHHGQDVRHDGGGVAGKKDGLRGEARSAESPKNARAHQAEEPLEVAARVQVPLMPAAY